MIGITIPDKFITGALDTEWTSFFQISAVYP